MKVMVTGGAGYVGSALVPRLLAAGHAVEVLDWILFGDDVFDGIDPAAPLSVTRGDIRDTELLARCLRGCDAVIHLACISNDPSFELDPGLGRSVNFDAFAPLVDLSKQAGVRRFVYASSSSVYGASDAPHVTEDHPLRPLTDYSRFKAECEPILLDAADDMFVPVVIRPATVCGVSPRLRLDLTVNILTTHAMCRGMITVFGGTQKRPNIHIDDLCDLYLQLLEEPAGRVSGRIFNAGYQNHTVADIAARVRSVLQNMVPGRGELAIETTPSDDLRSYHIDSDKIARELGFRPTRTIEDAVRDLVLAFAAERVPDALGDSRYYNVRTLKEKGEPRFAEVTS